MPPPLAGAGRFLEARLAPPFYRRDADGDAVGRRPVRSCSALGFRPEQVTAVDNGVDPFFTPGGARRRPDGRRRARMAPGQALRAAARRGARGPPAGPGPARALVGEGPTARRPRGSGSPTTTPPAGSSCSATRAREHGCATSTAGRWIVASASLAEGWGLSLTEGARRARRRRWRPTSAVIAASVVDGVDRACSPPPADLGARHGQACSATTTCARSGSAAAALARARTLTWDASALGVLRVFHRASRSQRSERPGPVTTRVAVLACAGCAVVRGRPADLQRA